MRDYLYEIKNHSKPKNQSDEERLKHFLQEVHNRQMKKSVDQAKRQLKSEMDKRIEELER